MSAAPAPARIGALWQQRMQGLREYDVVRDGNTFGARFSNSFVFSSKYDQARRYLESLISQNHGKTIHEVFPGRDIVNGGGCLPGPQVRAGDPGTRAGCRPFQDQPPP